MLGVLAHSCNPWAWEVEAGGTRVQRHLEPHSESEAGLH